jgi:hypothetical protein
VTCFYRHPEIPGLWCQKGSAVQFNQVQIKHFTRRGSGSKRNILNSCLGMYFVPSGFLSSNKEGSAHFKKYFTYN